MLAEISSTRKPNPSTVPTPAEFWRQLAADADSIRSRLLARASQSESPFERKRLERLALCASSLASILRPGGGGPQTGHKKFSPRGTV